MSQKARIIGVKVTGAKVFIGNNPYGNPIYTRNPDLVMKWLADGYRFTYNACRSTRALSGDTWITDEHGDHQFRYGLPVDTNIPGNVEIRERKSFLRSVPSSVIGSAKLYENKDWYSALKARKTVCSKGGFYTMPRFKSVKRNDLTFVVLTIKGKNTGKFVPTGKRTGVFYIAGTNQGSDSRSGKSRERYLITIRVKYSGKIRPFTSIAVNVTRGRVVFTNPPVAMRVKRKGRGNVGIDRGIARQIQLSNGEYASNVRLDENEQSRLLKLQRKFSRQKPGSNRAKETLRLMAVIREKSNNRADTFEHQVSASIARRFANVAMENLSIFNMTRSAKGTIENPGTNVRAKACLNRAILEQRWYALQQKIKYKTELLGGKVELVPPQNTSRQCSVCGHTSKENRESQAVFNCKNCGYTTNADLNAAVNILNKAKFSPVDGAGVENTNHGFCEARIGALHIGFDSKTFLLDESVGNTKVTGPVDGASTCPTRENVILCSHTEVQWQIKNEDRDLYFKLELVKDNESLERLVGRLQEKYGNDNLLFTHIDLFGEPYIETTVKIVRE